MKFARVLLTGEIAKYKRLSELTDEERKDSSMTSVTPGDVIMLEPREGRKCWRYRFDREVELLN